MTKIERSAGATSPAVGAAILGIGLAGLTEGIVLHQVLRWHNFVSAQVPPQTLAALQTNVFWDGVFHLAVTAVVVVGALLVYRASRRGGAAGRSVVGLLLVGWGVFHVVDHLVFHELLRLHDIRQGVANPQLYNWGYFALGVAIAAIGILTAKRAGGRSA